MPGYECSAHLYDIFDTKENMDFFLSFASPGDEILDVGAGTGRIAIPAARNGIRVWCVEPSPAMRGVLLSKIESEPDLRDRIEIVPATASSFRIERTFPVAILSGCFDHFLDDAERTSSLSNIAHHLKEGGKLIMDVYFALKGGSGLHPAGDFTIGGKRYRRFVEGREIGNDMLSVHLIFEIYGEGKLLERIEEESLVGRCTRASIHRLLEKTGFEVTGEFGDYERTPYKDGDTFLVIEATKI